MQVDIMDIKIKTVWQIDRFGNQGTGTEINVLFKEKSTFTKFRWALSRRNGYPLPEAAEKQAFINRAAKW